MQDVHAHPHPHTHTHTHACMPARMQTHTHTHTVQTDRDEGQCWLTEILEENFFQYSYPSYKLKVVFELILLELKGKTILYAAYKEN